MKDTTTLKAGNTVQPSQKQYFEIRDPATNEVIGSVPDMTGDDTLTAIGKAKEAFTEWSGSLVDERANILKKWYHLVIGNKAELAAMITRECGKPITESLSEVDYGASFIEWSAEQCRRTNGEIIPTNQQGRRLLSVLQPIGVVTAITPWNFPLAMITRKVSPALAAGCTVVLKPASATPLTALRLHELAREAGMPADVFQLITTTDSGTVGKILATDPRVRKITFTGSTGVGKQLMALAAGTVKKVSLELGGNAPYIIFADADLEEAAEGLIASKFRNSGQTCVCANRVLIEKNAVGRFIPLLLEKVRKLKVGNGSDPGVSIGPLIDRRGVQKVKELIADALDKGATLLLGGEQASADGNFFPATILSGVTPEMRCSQEEIFGPVIPILQFNDEQEAIHMANATPFGLAAYFHTSDLARTWRVSEALEYGIVGVNTGMISTAVAPFGGVKESGIGREGSQHSIAEFMERKYIAMAGL